MIPRRITESIDRSLNQQNIEKSIIVCGLSYKPDIEDMRDSPAFKILTELKKRGFSIATYDPYFKEELLEKYMIENNLDNFDFQILSELDEENVKKYNCLCVVQHHSKSDSRINEIYNNSEIPLIYDCQNKIKENSNSKTILDKFGS